jgi:hypothetical protein
MHSILESRAVLLLVRSRLSGVPLEPKHLNFSITTIL